jgi:hypothetical protein
VQLVLWASQDRQVQLDSQAVQVYRVQWVLRVAQVQQVQVDLLELLATLDQLAIRDRLEVWDLLGQLEVQESKVCQVQWDHQVEMVQLEQQDCLDHLVDLDLQVQQVLRVVQVVADLQELLEPLELLE